MANRGVTALDIELTSTAASLKFRNTQMISLLLYNACDHLSMLGLKLNFVSKKGP